VVESFRARRSVQEITKFVNYPQRIVFDIAKRYRTRMESMEASGSVTHKRHARKRMVGTGRVVKELKNSSERIQTRPSLLWGQN
jgi:hypothetical protein